jgi:hypothetical protein
MDLQRSPRKPETAAVRVDVVDRRRRFAEDRDARALTLQAAGLQLGHPVSAEDLVRKQSRGRERGCWVRRVGAARADSSSAGRRPARNGSQAVGTGRNGAGGSMLGYVQAEARHGVDVPVQA